MELHKAQIMAQSLMSEYGLNAKGWTFEFDRAKRRLGYCRGGDKIISLSAYYTLLNDEDLVREVILHEIAHALVGTGHGHGRVWKAKMVELGLKPNRTFTVKSDENKPQGKYIYACTNCQTKVHKHRRPKYTYACASCCNKYNGGKYTVEYAFKLQGV